MLIYLIITVACIIISVLLFRCYNSGRGGALASPQKRATYIFSLLFFILFIVFSVKTYYYSDIQTNKLLVVELKKEYCDLEKIVGTDNESLKLAKKKQEKIGELLSQIDNVGNKEYDTYFNIYIGILTTFIAFVIAFTFKNRILG